MSTNIYSQQRMIGYGGGKMHKNNGRGLSTSWKVFLRGLATIIGGICIVGGSRFRINIVRKLPDINQIEDFNFKQATTITDKNGIVLYRMFEENRQYVPYSKISKHFVNAVIATEDQRFRDNGGIDIWGMIRALYTDVTQGKTHGASTITQQLIKLIMLTPEKKIERKLKEIILALKIGSYIKKDISKATVGLSENEVDKKVKEKIMELYANLIFLGNNAYGIEAASQTYFDKPATELSILEAAVLAGIPQAPSRYDPFTNRAGLMGEIQVTDEEKNPVELTEALHTQLMEKIKENLESSKLGTKNSDQEILDFIKSILTFKLHDAASEKNYQVSYALGRKDIVLSRMFEEKYIVEFDLKKAFLEGLELSFHRGSTSIKAPHFVFRVIQKLQEQYSEETLQKGGLTVVTSLDYAIQKLAETSIEENVEKIKSNLANNASLLYMDSQNGDILAYVGSRDYNNEEIDGQVDIIQANRQPGSTIKPLLYALGFMKMAISIDSPIYDIKMKIGPDEPNNVDGSFRGLTTIKQALAGSRNIPAIKMFFGVGGERPLKTFLEEIGVTGLKEGNDFYGYPLAIGAAEMKFFDLATAYSHLSAMGKPAVPNPILEIRGPNNSLLYKKEVQHQKPIIPAGVAYLIWKMLVDTTNYPQDWVPMFTAPGKLTFATKSGTTNVVKGKEKLPRDGWLMTYTPSKVLGLRAGNTDGSPLHKDAYGGWINSGTRKSFVKKLIDGGYITNELPNEVDVKEVTISKLSGKLANAQTPLEFTKRSLSYLQTAPSAVDDNVTSIEIDKLCNGIPTELTPTTDLSKAWFIKPESILPDQRDQQDIVERRNTTGIEKYKEERGAITLTALTGSCAERTAIVGLGDITLNIIKPLAGEKITKSFSLWLQSKSSNTIKNIKISLGDQELKTIKNSKAGDLSTITTITLPDSIATGVQELKVVVIDDKGYSDSKTLQLTLIDTDTTPPYLMEDKIQVKSAGTGFTIALLFADESSQIDAGEIKQQDIIVHTVKSSNVASFTLSQIDTPLTRNISDAAGNKASGTIDPKKYLK